MKLFCLNLLSFFKHIFKKKTKKVVFKESNEDKYVLMSEPQVSTFNLEKHNHIFKSQQSNNNNNTYKPPIMIKQNKEEITPNNSDSTLIDFESFSSDSEFDSDEFSSALQF